MGLEADSPPGSGLPLHGSSEDTAKQRCHQHSAVTERLQKKPGTWEMLRAGYQHPSAWCISRRLTLQGEAQAEETGSVLLHVSMRC